MKIILCIFLAIISTAAGLSRISISCFMHGDYGCQTKCNLQCTLYDCTPRATCCDDNFHCNCDEIYELGSDQLTQSDFEFLDFNDLWAKTFQPGLFTDNIRKLIRKDKNFESYILSLLRNPHVSGDDIIAILNDKRPYWDDLFFLKSNQHFVKTKLIGAGKPLQYNDLNDHIDELQKLMKVEPVDDVAKVKHRRRIRKFLENINDIDDLEELLHLIKLSGNMTLYALAKSVLKNLGYGFAEDGEKAGKKGLLRDIGGGLAEANEEEIMDIATLNNFMTQPSLAVNEDIKVTPVVEKLSAELPLTKITTNQQPVAVVSDIVSATPLSVVSSNNASGLGQILPSMPVLSINENASYLSQVPASENASSMTAFNGNIQNIVSSFSSTGQTIPSSSTQKSDLGHRLYYIVVDENGKVSQANMVPKIPLMIPGNMAVGQPSQRTSQEMALSTSAQGNASSWYSIPPYPFGSTPPNTSASSSSFSMGLPTSFMQGLPYPTYPFAAAAPPEAPPQVRSGVGGAGNGNRGEGFWSVYSYTNNNNNNNN